MTYSIVPYEPKYPVRRTPKTIVLRKVAPPRRTKVTEKKWKDVTPKADLWAEAKRRAKQQRDANREARKASEASAREQIKRIKAQERALAKSRRQQERQKAALLRRQQRARAVATRKHKRIARRIWRRLI